MGKIQHEEAKNADITELKDDNFVKSFVSFIICVYPPLMIY